MIPKKKHIEELNEDDEIINDDLDELSDIDSDIEIPDEIEIDDTPPNYEDDDFSDEYYEDDDDIYNSSSEDRFDVIYNLNTNKHRQEGKHTMERDIIFKGRIEEKQEDYIESSFISSSTKLEIGSMYELESRYHLDYLSQKRISEDVFELIETKTSLNFRQNRRKPNKQIFNQYYEMLMKELNRKYTNYELFVELSYYFTDNIFNCFKLLEKNHALDIIKELKNKGYLKDLDNLNFI